MADLVGTVARAYPRGHQRPQPGRTYDCSTDVGGSRGATVFADDRRRGQCRQQKSAKCRPTSSGRDRRCRQADDLRGSAIRRLVRRERAMTQVQVDGLTINYDVQGEDEPLLLISLHVGRPCLLRLSASPPLPSTSAASRSTCQARRERQASRAVLNCRLRRPVAAFLGVIGIDRAHVAGCRSVRRSVSTWPPSSRPGALRSPLHSGWHATDRFLASVVEQWRALASALPTVADVVIPGSLPVSASRLNVQRRPEFVRTLEDYMRSRPAQPVESFFSPDRRGPRSRREQGASRG